MDTKPPPSPSVDPTAWQPILEAQQPGRPDILAKMMGLYLRDSRELVDTILAALANRDSEALLESAHGLKSCSAMVGASRLVELCDQLENLRSAQSLERPRRSSWWYDKNSTVSAIYFQPSWLEELHKARHSDISPSALVETDKTSTIPEPGSDQDDGRAS